MTVRNISAGAMRELFAQHSGTAMLACLTFDHPSMTTPARIVNNTENITFNGNTYAALPFELTLPDDIEDKIPSLEIRIDNVERTLVDLLRSVVDDLPAVTVDIVRVQGGTVTREIGPLSLSLMQSEINTGAQIVTLESFYDSDIAAGALPFDMPHPRTGDTITVRMKSPYSLSALGGTRYQLEMTIEVLP